MPKMKTYKQITKYDIHKLSEKHLYDILDDLSSVLMTRTGRIFRDSIAEKYQLPLGTIAKNTMKKLEKTKKTSSNDVCKTLCETIQEEGSGINFSYGLDLLRGAVQMLFHTESVPYTLSKAIEYEKRIIPVGETSIYHADLKRKLNDTLDIAVLEKRYESFAIKKQSSSSEKCRQPIPYEGSILNGFDEYRRKSENLKKDTNFQLAVDYVRKERNLPKKLLEIPITDAERAEVEYDLLDPVTNLVITSLGADSVKRNNTKSYKGIFLETYSTSIARAAVWGVSNKEFGGYDALMKIRLDLHNRCVSPASPHIFNGGTVCPSTASCALITATGHEKDDNELSGRIRHLLEMKAGVGVNITPIPARGTPNRYGGLHRGPCPQLNEIEAMACNVTDDPMRKGAVACWIESWHKDFLEVVQKRDDNVGSSVLTKTHIHVMLSSLMLDKFQEAHNYPQRNVSWHMFCPTDAPQLMSTHGKEFERSYMYYCNHVPRERQLIKPITEVMQHFLEVVSSFGGPGVGIKDHINSSSPFDHWCVISSGNLCTEVYQPALRNEIGICNLSSISVPSLITEEGELDIKLLHFVDNNICRYLNSVMRQGYYGNDRQSLMRYKNKNILDHNMPSYGNYMHRPIGVGFQGMDEALYDIGTHFGTDKMYEFVTYLAEAHLYGMCKSSIELVPLLGRYPSFKKRSDSIHKFSFDRVAAFDKKKLKLKWDELYTLRNTIGKGGMANCTLTLQAPTATSATVLGNTEGIQPKTSNVYRRTGNFTEELIINGRMEDELRSRNLWTVQLRTELIRNKGSLQKCNTIPIFISEKFPTAFEVSPTVSMKQAILVQPFMDQGMSTTFDISKENASGILPVLLHLANKAGVKTPWYYIRIELDGQKYGFDYGVDGKETSEKKDKTIMCERKAGDITCTSCSA